MLLNTNLIIFSMVTWTDTAKILHSIESFHKTFCDHLSAPRLLWDYNVNPLNKNSLGDQVAKGASQISGSVTSLLRQLQEVHSEVTAIMHQQTTLL